MRFKNPFLRVTLIALLVLPVIGLQPTRGAETEKLVQDSLKRFSIKIPADWKVTENAEATSVSITGEECVLVVSPVFRGSNLEELHRRMALQFAYRSVDGPPKKNKVKWDKRGVGNLKALDSVYDIKGGPEDAHKTYRVHVITLDGKKHKFSLIVTIPWDVPQKEALEQRLLAMVNTFAETD